MYISRENRSTIWKIFEFPLWSALWVWPIHLSICFNFLYPRMSPSKQPYRSETSKHNRMSVHSNHFGRGCCMNYVFMILPSKFFYKLVNFPVRERTRIDKLFSSSSLWLMLRTCSWIGESLRKVDERGKFSRIDLVPRDLIFFHRIFLTCEWIALFRESSSFVCQR